MYSGYAIPHKTYSRRTFAAGSVRKVQPGPILLGGGPFQKNKSYPHFLMLWSLYNRYLTLKIVSLQN